MTATWDRLPLRTRRAVTTHVEQQIATFRTDGLEDVIRWAVDGLLGCRASRDSYDEGFEDGRQAAMSETTAGAA